MNNNKDREIKGRYDENGYLRSQIDTGMQIEQLISFNEQDFEDLSVLLPELSERLTLSKDRLQSVIADPATRLYVARENGCIVGCASLCVYEVPSSRKGIVEDVVVSKEYRRRHIGKMLLKHIMTVVEALKPIELQLTSRPSRAAANLLYQSLGFKKVYTNCYRIRL